VILDRDPTNKTYESTSRCPNAVATGVLTDPRPADLSLGGL
jgi:hypothetical protein